MLLLARKLNEIIVIGDNIQIEIIMLDRERAIIGIKAPKEIPVHRKEVYDRRQVVINKIITKESKATRYQQITSTMKEISV